MRTDGHAFGRLNSAAKFDSVSALDPLTGGAALTRITASGRKFTFTEEPTMSLVKIIVITVLILLSILLFGRFLF